jgi:hypothetical protein
MENTEKNMHGIYLLCGGFIIGIACSLLAPFLWGLSRIIFNWFGALWVPTTLMKKCWGYW